MRELTIDEIDMVSAGPSAVTPLALVDQCNGSASMPTRASPGIFPPAGIAFVPNDPSAIAK